LTAQVGIQSNFSGLDECDSCDSAQSKVKTARYAMQGKIRVIRLPEPRIRAAEAFEPGPCSSRGAQLSLSPFPLNCSPLSFRDTSHSLNGCSRQLTVALYSSVGYTDPESLFLSLASWFACRGIWIGQEEELWDKKLYLLFSPQQ